jgi:hypothetical protein
MGSMYAAVLFIGVQNATSVQPVVAIERTVFYRERAAGMYSALPYAFAQVNWFRYSTLLSFWARTDSFINALTIYRKLYCTNTGHKHENMSNQNSEH